MTVLKILLVSVLVLFPFGELLRFQWGNTVGLKPLDVLVGITALVFFVKYLYHFKFSNLFKSILIKPIFLFCGIGLFSLLINMTWLKIDSAFISILYLFRWISYATLLPIVLSFDEKFKKKVITLLSIDGLVLLVIGFIQYFFFDNLKPYFHLGWDEHMHRMFSTFLDPNFAGAFFVLFFLFVASRLITEKSKRGVLLASLFLTLIAIFLTFSRSALIMLLVGSITFLVLINKKKFIFMLLAVITLFILIASPLFYKENMNLFREASSKARLANYAAAVRIIQDRPILGVGFNSYRYAKDSYGMSPLITTFPSHADAGVDNSFLFVLVTTGIAGLLAYLWMWFEILKKMFLLVKKKHSLAVLVVSSSVALFVDALFINSLFFPGLMLWMWIIIGLSWNDSREHL